MKKITCCLISPVLLFLFALPSFSQENRRYSKPRLGGDHFHSQKKSGSVRKKQSGFRILPDPFRSGYFSLTADVKQFHFSSRSANISLEMPYQVYNPGGMPVSDTVFRGSTQVKEETSHPEFRTLIGTDFHFRRGPSFYLGMSVSSDPEPYGRYMNFDFFEAGMHYDFAIARGKNVPRFIFYPYLGYLRRDKDYNIGSIQVPDECTLEVEGKGTNGAKGNVGIALASVERLLRLGLGAWYVPFSEKQRVSSRLKLSRLSFRAQVTYDLLIASGNRIYLMYWDHNDAHAFRYFGNRYAKHWVHTNGPGPINRFDGFSVSAGLVFCLAR
jgi:hypothetical protein